MYYIEDENISISFYFLDLNFKASCSCQKKIGLIVNFIDNNSFFFVSVNNVKQCVNFKLQAKQDLDWFYSTFSSCISSGTLYDLFKMNLFLLLCLLQDMVFNLHFFLISQIGYTFCYPNIKTSILPFKILHRFSHYFTCSVFLSC